MNRWLGWMMIPGLLLLGCNGGPSSYVASGKARKQTQTELRESIKKWAPHLTLGWEVPLQSGTNIRNIWVNKFDVLVETDKHRLWQIKRESGDGTYPGAMRPFAHQLHECMNERLRILVREPRGSPSEDDGG